MKYIPMFVVILNGYRHNSLYGCISKCKTTVGNSGFFESSRVTYIIDDLYLAFRHGVIACLDASNLVFFNQASMFRALIINAESNHSSGNLYVANGKYPC